MDAVIGLPNSQVLAEVMAREYRRHEQGSPLTLIAMYRLLRGLTGFDRVTCLVACASMFPAEAEAYDLADARGDLLPPLDREEYLERRLGITFNAEKS
jgi:hypothetical protein